MEISESSERIRDCEEWFLKIILPMSSNFLSDFGGQKDVPVKVFSIDF